MGYQPSVETSTENLRVVTTMKDLVSYFEAGITAAEDARIGMEVEKQGIHRDTHKPVKYLEQNGTRKIQEKMVEELGWEIEKQEGKFITSLKRGATRITLDVGEAMSELSGRTHPSIHDLARELRIHQHEFSEISRLFNVTWLGIGYQPFAAKKEIDFMKIQRYEILQNYLKRRSIIGKEFFKSNCSLQANIDYTSQDDARKKFQMLLRLGPFLAAMYAHSPIAEGKNTGFVSYRTHLMRQVDTRRFGIRKIFLSKKFSFEKWADFCMRIPMIAIVREGKWIPIKKMTFTQFMKSGYEGYSAIMEDWTMHLSFIYTDTRIKQYIELRVCDSLPPFLIPSMQAIVKAFVYHDQGEAVIKELTKDWNFQDFFLIYRDIAKRGMQAEHKGKKLIDYCSVILNAATAHLRSLKVLNEKEQDESVHLEPIKEFVFVKEKSPGEWVRDQWDGEWKQNPDRLLEWCSFETSNGHG